MKNLEQRIVEHIPRLRRYAHALLRGDALAADDLVQDCLERALSRLHLWRSGSDLRAWLFTIMHNLYVNQLRRAAAAPPFVPLEAEPAAGPLPAEGELALGELHSAVDALPPDQREILVLVCVEGLAYREVAQILGIPEGTVMSRLFRARQRLRARLDAAPAPSLRRIK